MLAVGRQLLFVNLAGGGMENTAMTLLVPSPVAMETIPSILHQASLQCEVKVKRVERLERGRKNHTKMWRNSRSC